MLIYSQGSTATRLMWGGIFNAKCACERTVKIWEYLIKWWTRWLTYWTTLYTTVVTG